MTIRNIASCVGKDAIVDVGIFQRAMGVLVEAVEE